MTTRVHRRMHSLDPVHVVTPGPEPAYCPRCELRHTRRDDWLCPRCRSPVETEVPPPRTVAAPQPPPRFPLGARVAGALLLATIAAFASAVARGLAVVPPGAQRWRLLAMVVALAALGLALLLKSSAARWIAVGFAVVAAVVLVEGLLRDRFPGLVRDPLPAAVRQLLRDLIRDHRPTTMLSFLGFDAGCLLLVLGRPRAVRLAAGVFLALPLLALEVLAALGR